VNFDCGWFYNIIQAQTLVLGYGISLRSNPQERLLEYSNAAAASQSFINLYYGNKHQIKDLEVYVKTEWKEQRLSLSTTKLEWLDPKWGLNVSDLEHLVHDRIVKYPYDTIRRVKAKFMPYSSNDTTNLFSTIQSNPDFFLEEVKLTKNKASAIISL
jgi:hypothetical protein